MLRSSRFVVLFLLAAGVWVVPVHAQETDTTAADTTGADTTAVEPGAADTTGVTADTLQAPADSVQGATADTLAADTLAADTLAADTTAGRDTSAVERRQQAARDSAQAAAEEWLAFTDAGDFGESWDAADSTLQARISREDWIDQGRRAHGRLDSLHSRSLTTAAYRDSSSQIAGQAPVVLLQYDSEYGVGATREAVITTKRDSGWKVAGYRMIPAKMASDSTGVSQDSTQESGQ